MARPVPGYDYDDRGCVMSNENTLTLEQHAATVKALQKLAEAHRVLSDSVIDGVEIDSEISKRIIKLEGLICELSLCFDIAFTRHLHLPEFRGIGFSPYHNHEHAEELFRKAGGAE